MAQKEHRIASTTYTREDGVYRHHVSYSYTHLGYRIQDEGQDVTLFYDRFEKIWVPEHTTGTLMYSNEAEELFLTIEPPESVEA